MGWTVRILVALCLVVAGVIAGALIRGRAGTTIPSTAVNTPTTTTTQATVISSIPATTSPSPSNGQDIQIMTAGCRSLQGLAGQIASAEASSDAQSLSSDEGAGSAWAHVTAMQVVGAMPAYQQLASDVGGLIQGWSVADTTGVTTALDSALGSVEDDCGTLNYPTANNPNP